MEHFFKDSMMWYLHDWTQYKGAVERKSVKKSGKP